MSFLMLASYGDGDLICNEASFLGDFLLKLRDNSPVLEMDTTPCKVSVSRVN